MKRQETSNRKLTYLILFLVLFCWNVSAVLAQDATNKRGFQPAGSYAMSDFETINTTNGNVMLRLPLGSLPGGRGGLRASINLVYNSKLYDSEIAYFRDYGQQCQYGEWGDPISCPYYQKSLLQASAQGGWRYSLGYGLEVTDRRDQYLSVPYQEQPQCQNGGWGYAEMTYVYKLKVKFPDGSSHEMRPYGFTDWNSADPLQDYYHVRPDGLLENCGGPTSWYTGTIVYYSTDGSYHRLEVQHDTDSYWWNNPWTLYLPDGSRVTGGNAPQRIYDRNNNYVEISAIENYNGTGHFAYQIVDQLNRSITLEYNGAAPGEDTIVSQGFGGTLTSKVKWKMIGVTKSYLSCSPGPPPSCPYGTEQEAFTTSFNVVEQITLPVQAGPLSYTFNYNAPTWVPGNQPPSVGWGEVSSIALPSGAQASYQYAQDNGQPPQTPSTQDVLRDYPTLKTLSFDQVYDGITTPVSETWGYSIAEDTSWITAPDGGVTTDSFRDTGLPYWDSGLVHKTVRPDGSVVERIWAKNNLADYGTFGTYRADNPYVKTEFTSIKNAAGSLVKTAIKDHHYDKNGNVTQVAEYDWVDYGTVPRDAQGKPTGLPSGAQPARVTVNSYYNSTPDADQLASGNNVYWLSSSPRLRNVIAWNEVQTAIGQRLTRSEFFYDDFSITGNLIEQKSWDSTKGGYSDPLTPGNSISVSTQYNPYGSPILATDARGYQTQFIYGNVGGVVDLYPTQIRSAYGTTIQRTENREYDFGTGLVTRVTDADNNVSTAITYDVFGRPTLVKAAEGKPEETRTTTLYSDVDRRVIVKADMNTLGDGKLVSIQHYDQLGRVRLSRQLEDSATQDPTIETQGIKVQTRYLFCSSTGSAQCPNSNSTTAGSYQIVSNPYRANFANNAGGESTMGWSRTRNDPTGRTVEVQTFGGTALPWPWGGNTTGTGAVTMAYDANQVTVTDQAGKQRKSVTDGLGRLVQVYEAPNDPSYNHLTSYSYDTLDSLITVNQGGQTRTFAYSSLARLVSANNPESGTISYSYDDNGNLTAKTDARSITTSYVYDSLNRATTRSYSDGTPTVTYSYDTVAQNGKGRLASVSSSVSSYNYSGYDAMGRVLGGTQTIGSQSYSISNIVYDLAGHLKTMTYPSGRSVTNTFDNAGRLQSFVGTLGDATSRTYANEFEYTALNGLQQEKLGTTAPIYHKQRYNSRGQLWDMRASTVSFASDPANGDRGALVNYYSNNFVQGGSGADNNGNLLRQENYIPGSSFFQDNFEYDQLNRLKSIAEKLNGTGADSLKQAYSYDRYGNRTIDQANTFGANIPKPDFTVSASNNRLGVPGGQSGTMSYDNSGNLITDTYSAAAVTRVYDAENKMTSETTYNSVVAGSYSYDGDGRRVKRIVGGVETWQVYGIGGELLAEYAANADDSTPQKEYGYRNGELLITATVATGWGAPPSYTGPNPLSTGDQVKLENLTELRSAVNQLRQHAGLAAYNFSVDPNPQQNVTPVKADHIRQLRTALEGARTALGLSIGGYEHPTLTENFSLIFAVDFQELRGQILSAWQSGGGVDIRWLVADHLGTPRMIFDQTGSLANVSRHDYLPFGEELYAGTGGRTTGLGYTANDNVRQKFTGYERDNESGLDYAQARYFGSSQGRFTSADPLGGHTEDPQTLNRYTYVRNNPERFTDPTGLDFNLTCKDESSTCHKGQVGTYDKKKNFTATIIKNDGNGALVDQRGNVYTARISGQGVSFNGAGSKEYVQGVFLNGTNATTVQGSRMDGLEGFTFRFTYSDPKKGQTAAGSWSFNGNAYEARDALKNAGYFHYLADGLNFFHPSVDNEYAAVDYRSPGDKDSNHSGHFTIHVPITNSYQPTPDGWFMTVRIPKRTVPTVGDVHLNEHNPWQSLRGMIGHLPEIRF